jgi:flavin-dependent dehydrogenase
VRVLEACESLEPESRTLIVTRHLWDLLGQTAAACIVNEIRRFELFTDGRSASVALRQPDLVIERAKLIRALAEEARCAGATIEYGSRFVSISGRGNKLALQIDNRGKKEEVQAATLVGADGTSSRVARAAGWPAPETAGLIQAIVRPPKDCPADTVRIWFVPEDTPYFYWLIPESAERGALGLIAEDLAHARECLERFTDKRGFQPMEFQGGRIPVYRGWVPVRRRLADAQVFLVGDAAAQVKVSTLGGVVTGFRGARGVAEAILNGGHSREFKTLRRELGLHWLVRRALHGFRQSDYSRLVDLLDDEARRALGNTSRDQVARLLWSLVRRRPRLLLLGLRGLLLGRRGTRA